MVFFNASLKEKLGFQPMSLKGDESSSFLIAPSGLNHPNEYYLEN